VSRDRHADFRIPRSALTDPSDPAQVAWDVIEPLWDELETPYQPDERLRTTATPGQRALYALHWTNSEVCNGGFHQYFTNSTGMLTPDALFGARLVRATEYATTIERAASIFGPEVPSVHEERRAHLQRLDKDGTAVLDECDERWYKLIGSPATALEAFVASYIQEHPNDFFVPSRELPPSAY
jgi:hypothetical protein